MSERSEQKESKPNQPKFNQKEKKQETSSALEKPCLYCSKDHSLEFCGVLKSIHNNEKVEFMKNEGLCFGCLGRGHMSRYCKNRMTCQICHQNHPSILHFDLKEKVEPQWDVESDAFTFSAVLKPQPTTRRGILSVVSSVYDPLGFLAPVVLSAKQILQELCKA